MGLPPLAIRRTVAALAGSIRGRALSGGRVSLRSPEGGDCAGVGH
jgi:hypothetical protein